MWLAAKIGFGAEDSRALIPLLNLNLPTIDLQNYKSASQRARIGTESWGASNLFCASCESPRLVQATRNTPAIDFACPVCHSTKPLAPTARRAGWIGCNILLVRIPQDARIPVIQDGTPCAPSGVRRAYQRLRPIEELKVEKRGWTLDVLQIVRSLDKPEFTLAEVYSHDMTLARLHPQNAHVHDKIRQQLQVLRDLGFLSFLGRGSYRLK